jgi:hypothetical protein
MWQKGKKFRCVFIFELPDSCCRQTLSTWHFLQPVVSPLTLYNNMLQSILEMETIIELSVLIPPPWQLNRSIPHTQKDRHICFPFYFFNFCKKILFFASRVLLLDPIWYTHVI